MSEKPLLVHLEGTDQHSGQYTLTFDPLQYPIRLQSETSIAFSEWLRRLHPVLIGGRDPSGELTQDELLRNIGTWLWQALLPDNAPTQEREVLAHLLRTGRTPLLLEFPDILAGLPWELLCDPEQSDERGFLARRRPLMRLSAKAGAVPPIEPPLRVLLLISSPPSLGEDSRVDVESERAAVEHAVHSMREAGLVHLLVEDIVTQRRVQQAIMRFNPHIVHYIGHGKYSDTNGGVLLWEDEQGNALELSAERLASLLRPRNLYAVVLHACQTGRKNLKMDFTSASGMLVKEGIPAVLAQQANFTYESSQRASEAWYTALTTGQSFAEALFEVRQALSLADRPDWAVPILQANTFGLVPLLNTDAPPGSPDPLLKSFGAVADLPTPTGIFVGRHREMRDLRLMLESMPGSGPVIALITGPGGVGKSTLAAQAVTRYGGKYKATLTLSCLGYQSVELFLQRIGEFLKRQGSPGFLEHTLPDPKLSTTAKIEEAIAALNTAGPLLLVIDNLESVQNKDQTISDKALLHLLQKLLTNLRRGRVLITGRYAVKDLLPQGKFAANLLHLDLCDLSNYETNQLLIRHPTLAQLGETVRKRLMDEFGGLPYMYDLLSSHAARQSLDLLIHDIQGRITEARKQHTAKEWQHVRQQVIEFAALEATINRLPPASRTLLAQLSLLRHPFPLGAIEEALGAVRATWQPLLDWSLLRYDSREQCYHLHNLTKRYTEGLLEENERKQAQGQLAIWYQRYAYQESRYLEDFLEACWFFRMSGQLWQAAALIIDLSEGLVGAGLHPLLREVCTTILHDGGESDDSLAASLLFILGTIARLESDFKQARELLSQGLVIFERLDEKVARRAVLVELGIVAFLDGDSEQAQSLLQQSLENFEQLGNSSEQQTPLGKWGNQRMQAVTLHELGHIALSQGDSKRARMLYQQSLAIDGQLEDHHGRAMVLHSLGNLAMLQGDYEEARRLLRESLKICARLRDQRGRVISLYTLANLAYLQGDHQEARQLYQQTLEIFEQVEDPGGRATVLRILGKLAFEQEEYEEAHVLLRQSLAIKERLGDQNGQARTLNPMAILARVPGKDEGVLEILSQRSLEIQEQQAAQSGHVLALLQLGMRLQERGKYEEARKHYQQCLDLFKRQGNQLGQGLALLQLGMVPYDQGENEEAYRHYQQSLDLLERQGNQSGQALILHALGISARDQGDYDQAFSFYQRALALEEQLRNESEQAASLHELGWIAELQGQYKQARDLYQRSLDIKKRLGDGDGQASTLYQLGRIAHERGEYQEARAFYQQTLEIAERLGDERGRAATLYQLGRIAQTRDEYEQARALYQQCLIIEERLGNQHTQAAILYNLGSIAHQQGEYDLARGFYQQSLTIEEQQGHQRECAAILLQLGTIAQEVGEYEQARGLYQQYLEIKEPLEDQNTQAPILRQLGIIAQKQGEYEQAHQFYQQSLAHAEQMKDQSEQANTLYQLGMTAQDQEEYEQARGFYEQCLDLFEQLGDQRWQANTLRQLGIIAEDNGEYEEARGLCQRSLDLFILLEDLDRQAMTLHDLAMIAHFQEEYERSYQLYQQSLVLREQLNDQHGQAMALHQLGHLAQDQGEYEKAQSFYERSLAIKKQLGDQSGQARSLVSLGLVAYNQRNFENALMYTVQAYFLFDALQSPDRASVQSIITRIRIHMNEETFIAHWRTFAGDRPLIAVLEETEDTAKGKGLALLRFLDVISSVILQGTVGERQRLASYLPLVQKQLPPELRMLEDFFLGWQTRCASGKLKKGV